MTFILAEKKLIRGCAAHIAAGLGCGADYEAYYVPVYAPFAAKVFEFNEVGGGRWLRFTRADGYRVEVAHLNERWVPSGAQVAEGQAVAQSGNSGVITDYPHAHVQVFDPKGKRIDPVSFFSGAALPNTHMNEDLENWAIIQNPGGEKGFFKGGLNHKFATTQFTNGIEHYNFTKTSKFIPAARYNALPKGTMSAEEVLKGGKDW